MESSSAKKIEPKASGHELIADLINDAKEQGLHDAVKTLEEFREMLIKEKFLK